MPRRPRVSSPQRRGSALTRLIGAIAVLAILYLGGQVLIPMALAVLLSLALAPLVTRLERVGLPTVAAVGLIVTLTFAALGGLGYVVTQQVLDIAASLPAYRENIESRMRALRARSEGGAIGEAARMVGEIQKEIEEQEEQEAQEAQEEGAAKAEAEAEAQTGDAGPREERLARRAAAAEEEEPLLVRIEEPPPKTLEVIENVIGPVFSPLATAAIVVVFVIFFLLQRKDLRDRIVRVAGESRLDVTTQAMDEAAGRISRYLLTQVVLNVSYGLPVMIGLWLIGLPGAVLWGVLSGVLRFIPYVGPWVAAGLPVLVSLAVFDGWLWPLVVVGLFVGLELFSNNVLEPWLYGSSSGLSAVAVIVAAVFWGWMWGAMGLLLAVPMTVCIFVLGKYLPQLEVLSVLLGRDPALSPDARLYQRTLAGDEEEALELVQRYRDENGLLALYDRVVIPALHMKERDRHAGRLDDVREARVQEDLEELVEALVEWFPTELGPEVVRERKLEPQEHTLLCLPARDEADALSARLLAHLTVVNGMQALAVSASMLAAEVLQLVEQVRPRLVCIAAVPPAAVSRSRYLCLRLRKANPDLRIVVGLWNAYTDPRHAAERLREAGADDVVTTLEDALARAGQVLGFPVPSAARGRGRADGPDRGPERGPERRRGRGWEPSERQEDEEEPVA